MIFLGLYLLFVSIAGFSGLASLPVHTLDVLALIAGILMLLGAVKFCCHHCEHCCTDSKCNIDRNKEIK